MKQAMVLFFVLIVLAVHFGVNYYIYVRGSQGLEAVPQIKASFRWVMLFLALAYPVGRLLEKIWLSPVSDVFHWVGAFWFAGMLYAFLFLVSVDLGRLFNWGIGFLPETGSVLYVKLKLWATITVLAAVLLVVTGGFLNAWHPQVSYRQLAVAKKANGMDRLRIVAVSDVHMGTIIAKRKVGKMVDAVMRQKPDIILFAGDVVDEDVQPVIRENLGRNLLDLKAPLGVYAVTGNHEFIGGAERATEYLSTHGLTMLRDTVVKVNGAFYLVGRDDRDKSRFSGVKRKGLDELLEGVDKQLPIVMLDHQPFDLGDVAAAGVDLQISGHTHHGQLWPFGWVTNKIFEVSRGYLKKGDTHFYVSIGFGTWGPPVRTGNRPELMVFDLVFEK